MALFEPFFDALNRADVRYVVVGGFATVLHGFARLTGDIDLVIDVETEAARHAIDTFVALGLRPRAPVDPYAFVDANVRRQWFAERNMRVFSLWDPTNAMLEVDVFVEPPIPFESLWERAEIIQLETSTVRVASIHDLIDMKREANRPQDHADIEALEAIVRRKP